MSKIKFIYKHFILVQFVDSFITEVLFNPYIIFQHFKTNIVSYPKF
nr:MAG TPA: hypothetical protein [Caudoviricetes sp.]